MALLKLAFNPIPFIAPGISGFIAKSGNPLGYLTRKAKNHRFTKFLQNSALSGAANIEASMRKGNVADATKFHSAIAESYMGQFGAMGAEGIQELRNLKGAGGMLINGLPQEMINKMPNKIKNKIKFKGLLNEFINDNGQYNIPNIERRLNQAKQYHDNIEYVSKIPITTLGSIGGGAIGYATSNEDDNKFKSTMKGAIKGGILGASARGAINMIRKDNIYKNIPKLHKEYFQDNYWRDALNSANTGFYRKIGKGLGESLTSNKFKRMARMDTHSALTELKDVDWNQPKEFYQKSKKLGKNFIDSFKSEEYLKQKYGAI